MKLSKEQIQLFNQVKQILNRNKTPKQITKVLVINYTELT